MSSVLRPLQHSIGYMEDGFYGSKDPTNSIKVLKAKAVKEINPKKQNRQNTMTSSLVICASLEDLSKQNWDWSIKWEEALFVKDTQTVDDRHLLIVDS